jgi:hypothetical protein
MKKNRFAFTAVLLISLMLLPPPAKRVAAQPFDLKAAASAFVETLARADFAAAVKSFGAPLNRSLPAAELQKTWQGIIAKNGSFAKIVGVQAGPVEEYGGQKYDVVLVQCQLKQAAIVVRLSFNRQAQITSLWFVPPAAPAH